MQQCKGEPDHPKGGLAFLFQIIISMSLLCVIMINMGKLLSKSDIFAKKGLDPREVEVPEWGGTVRYRPMSMVERREVRKKCTSTIVDSNGQSTIEMDMEKFEVMALIYCVLEPGSNNKLMFKPDDVAVLEEQMAAGGISTVAQAILRDSGMAGNATFRSKEKTEK